MDEIDRYLAGDMSPEDVALMSLIQKVTDNSNVDYLGRGETLKPRQVRKGTRNADYEIRQQYTIRPDVGWVPMKLRLNANDNP